MNRFHTLLAVAAVALLAGLAAGYWWLPRGDEATAVTGSGEREILYWRAPMDPTFRRDEPGKSPMGMDLVPVYADASSDDPGVVTINPAIVNNLGVRTAPAAEGPLSRQIDTVGYVRFDEDTVHHVHTRADGWIEKLAIKAVGDPVSRGEILFELYSPTLVNAQEEYLAALRSGNAPLEQASRARLEALGLGRSDIDALEARRTVRQRIPVIAQADGVVVHLGVREGMYITPSTDVMTLAGLDRVWILANVFERQSAWVAPGQRTVVTLDYHPGERWEGTVDYVYPEIDPKTRSLTVRIRLDNAAFKLRPNMYASVSIIGTPTNPVVHVPREALIRGGHTDRVVLALGDGRFRAQPVDVGIEAGDRVEIRSGIAPDDTVVTSGQFLIDSESNIDSALMRMNGETGSEHDGMDHEQ